MRMHFIEGAPGCAYAARHAAAAIVVDALRASATAAMLLEHGAESLLVTASIASARAARAADPEALLYGERGGLPPEGFDYGNSPAETIHAAGRRVIFTTTTGAGRMVACEGAHARYFGGPLNASAVAAEAARHGRDIVIIPAGKMDDPAFDAQEDWAGAVCVGMRLDLPVGEGAEAYRRWRARIQDEGLPALFQTAPHAADLRAIGLGDDIARCAAEDVTGAIPTGAAREEHGVRVLDARAAR